MRCAGRGARVRRATLTVLAALLTTADMTLSGVEPAAAAGVVGIGTPESCTDAALSAALVGGGLVTFDCGAEPVVITTSGNSIASDTTVDGGGTITLSGGDAVRVFGVHEGAALAIENLTLADGWGDNGGGAIRNNGGDVTVTNCIVRGNDTGGEGSGILNWSGTLTVANSTLADNGSSGIYHLAIYNERGTVTVTDSTFSHNDGGIESSQGEVTVTGSVFSDNGSLGIWLGEGSTVTVVNSTFTGNHSGGIVHNPPWGPADSDVLTVIGSTFSNNWAGIVSVGPQVTIADSTFDSNVMFGIANDGLSVGSLTVSNSTFVRNTGSGILNARAVAAISSSTFSGNSTPDVGGGIVSGFDTLTVTNCTFAANSAGTWGGGISYGGEALTVINSTFTGNSAPSGGGIYTSSVGTLTLANTIIAGSANGGDCVGDDFTVVNTGHNLIEDAEHACGLADGVNGNLVGVDPLLDPAGLQDHGGSTQTVALLPDSPALDAGDPAVCADPPVNGVDQRGHVRPGLLHAQCSIGAYEADGLACQPTPRTCRTAGRSQLLVRDKHFDGDDRLTWRLLGGARTLQAELGDPTASADYALCIYAGPAAVLVGESVIPSNASQWSALGSRGYTYKDATAERGGIIKMRLEGSEKDRSRILVRGRGAYLPDLPLPIAAPVTVQLFNGDTGLCWGASFGSSQLVKNESGLLKAKSR